MLELKQIKDYHDKAFTHGQVIRERAADDMVFYWVTQWDDNLLGESQLQYKGEFNILRRAGRQIITDLRANPVQVDFEPKAEMRDDGADLMDGLYRSDDRVNTSIESFDNASGETVVCGVGAWELCHQYESDRAGNDNQVIRRKPLYEANATVFWDTNAKLLDKSDANWCSILESYSEDGYIELVKELTGEDIDGSDGSFAQPQDSYAFPWIDGGQDKLIYVVKFYHREKVKDKVITLADPFGQPLLLRESDVMDIMDDLIDEGYEIIGEKTIKRWKVTKYVASGSEILKTYDIACDHIPVVPQYGERAYVEGVETYEGVTKLAKDPSRLRNFQMSYLADIVARSPRPKPIFYPEQIQGFEFMYEENGADSNYPYLYMNSKAKDGTPLPLGPVAQMPEQPMPTALAQSIALTREAVGDVAPANVSQDLADIDLSGKAVVSLQARLDEQSMTYQENRKHALRRDAEIYASMASYIYDVPREVTLTKPDGTREKAKIMEIVQDKESGEMVAVNDITNMEFDVFADIGPSYSTKKEQTFDQLGAMVQSTAATNPAVSEMLTLKQLTLIDGINMDDVREYANKQLVLKGYKEPETDDEIALVQQAQQNQQPDPAMALAIAEQGKADAAKMEVQRKSMADQFKARTDMGKLQVSEFDAQTKRMAVQVDAVEADANIDFKRIDQMTKRLESVNKPQNFRASATAQ